MFSWQFSRLTILYPLILFLLFFLDGNVMAALTPLLLGGSFHILPLGTLIWFFYAIQFELTKDMPFTVYVILIGLFFDIYYTGIVGTYTVAFLVATLLMRAVRPYFDERLLSALLLFLIGLGAYLGLSYFFSAVVGMTSLTISQFVYLVALPTAVLNLLLAAVFYYPAWSLLQRTH
ncbi:rod shape-determining protein MreD [Leuconostocaceae bacterium ESL0958]|nr:rod shape-determining protein MreD [Leuconostocaceae bacterium ESL0958]